MLNVVTFQHNDKMLDLGCGYGVVGIIAAQSIKMDNVYMSDVSEIAVRFALENSEYNGIHNPKVILSDGFSNIKEKDFSLILSNPPYHNDFKIPKEFIENGFHHLKDGGKMYMVTKRKLWYMKKFIRIFGGVKVYEREGYFVFEAEKKILILNRNQKNKQLSKKLSRKYGKN
jgi:16S rRNA (guanine1207-N2)-methyltransferase